MAAHIDGRVFDVIRRWTGLELQPDSVDTLLCTISCRLGGAGIPIITPILQAGYADSRYRALTALPYHAAPEGNCPLPQKVASEEFQKAIVTRISADPFVRLHLREFAKKHASRWLSAHRFHMPRKLYAAWFRRRVLGRLTSEPDRMKCGCGRAFDYRGFVSHVVGCASRKGNNSNVKHNEAVDLLVDFCKRAGVTHEPEPRGFQRYKCYVCQQTVEYADAKAHKKKCRVNLLRSGPDLRAWDDDDEKFYDYTTLHITAPCYLQELVNGVSEKRIVDRVVATKCDTYRLNFPAESFVVIVAFEHGGLEKNLVDLIRTLADAAKTEASLFLDEFSVKMATSNADALHSAIRSSSPSSFLKPPKTPALPRSDGHHPTRTPISPLESQNPPKEK